MRANADVIVVGGGPAGSTCAWRLGRAGMDVVVIDRATFPRDKVCAGWITPAVVERLSLDLTDYARGRTLQPFTGFNTALLGREPRLTAFDETVSYGIRRCEFDAYLLKRSEARVQGGHAVQVPSRKGGLWMVGDARAPMLVGAGGHFCPVARYLNPSSGREDVVAAQEVEFRMADRPNPAAGSHGAARRVREDAPELYFWPDLQGYGWCVRKGDYLNIGAGRLRPTSLPSAVDEFRRALDRRGLLPETTPRTWKGHAYLLNRTSRRRIHDDGVVLAGDAAGLALAPSGEGILPAVESGLLAADTILRTAPKFTRDRLENYASAVSRRFDWRPDRRRTGLTWPDWIATAAGRLLLGSDWMTRRLLIENGFLHRYRSAA